MLTTVVFGLLLFSSPKDSNTLLFKRPEDLVRSLQGLGLDDTADADDPITSVTQVGRWVHRTLCRSNMILVLPVLVSSPLPPIQALRGFKWNLLERFSRVTRFTRDVASELNPEAMSVPRWVGGFGGGGYLGGLCVGCVCDGY